MQNANPEKLLASYTQASDSGIEAAFHQTYIYKTHLQGDSIQLEAKNGHVTLTGAVALRSSRNLAQTTVESLPGVACVGNQIAVEGDNSDSSDRWLGCKIRLVLLFRHDVSMSKTKVEVKDAVVTLSGEAISKVQRGLTTELALDINGVTNVINQMTVAADAYAEVYSAAEEIDDVSITAQVRTTLQARRTSNLVCVSVMTRNGKVTITGIASNETEKSLIGRIAGDTRGVSSVDNLMTLEEVKYSDPR